MQKLRDFYLRKKDVIVTTLLVVIALLLIFVCISIIIDTNTENKKDNKNDVTEENGNEDNDVDVNEEVNETDDKDIIEENGNDDKDKTEEVIETFPTSENTLDLTKCIKGTCNYTIKVNGVEKAVVYKRSESDEQKNTVTIGEKLIYNELAFCGRAITIESINDVVAVWSHQGCTWAGSSLDVFNMNGEKIFDSSVLEKWYHDNVNPIEYLNSYKIIDNSIYLTIVKGYGKINGIYLCEDGTGRVNEDLPTNTITGLVYKINYINDSTVSSPIVDKNLTIKDAVPVCE